MKSLKAPFTMVFVLAFISACTNPSSDVSTPTEAAADEEKLTVEVYVSSPAEINVTSALIMGPTEMMVVSAQGTKSAATELADLIESKGLDLKYIFLTHAHADHSQGAGIIKERFPNARFIASPLTALAQNNRIPTSDAISQARLGDNAAVPSIRAEAFHGSTLLIDDLKVHIESGLIGDVGVGAVTEPHSALYIPSANAFLPSDIIYFNAHMMMGGSTPESRAAWVVQIDDWIARDFDMVVPGHIHRDYLGDLTAAGALNHSREYLLAYEEAIAESSSSEELIETMITLYPEMPHQSALYLGAYINFDEMDKAMTYLTTWQFQEE